MVYISVFLAPGFLIKLLKLFYSYCYVSSASLDEIIPATLVARFIQHNSLVLVFPEIRYFMQARIGKCRD